MRKKQIDVYTVEIESLVIKPDRNGYSILGKMIRYKNNELYGVDRIDINSTDSEELSEIINEIKVILDGSLQHK